MRRKRTDVQLIYKIHYQLDLMDFLRIVQ